MKRQLLVIVTMTAALLVASVGYAGAAGRGEAGKCSGGSSEYQLTVRRASASTLKVKFTVSKAKPGSSWQLFGSDDGDRIFAVSKTASRRGVVSVAKAISNLPGIDTIKASGYDATSGDMCNATLAF